MKWTRLEFALLLLVNWNLYKWWKHAFWQVYIREEFMRILLKWIMGELCFGCTSSIVIFIIKFSRTITPCLFCEQTDRSHLVSDSGRDTVNQIADDPSLCQKCRDKWRHRAFSHPVFVDPRHEISPAISKYQHGIRHEYRETRARGVFEGTRERTKIHRFVERTTGYFADSLAKFIRLTRVREFSGRPRRWRQWRRFFIVSSFADIFHRRAIFSLFSFVVPDELPKSHAQHYSW